MLRHPHQVLSVHRQKSSLMFEITSSKRLLLSMQTIQLIQDQTTNQNHYQNYQESLKKQKRRPLAPEINTNHQYHNDGKGDKASLGRKLTGEYTRRTTYRLFQTVRKSTECANLSQIKFYIRIVNYGKQQQQ